MPEGSQFHQLLPALIDATLRHLTQDNHRYRDRIRLKMSIALGPVGHGALGLSQATVVELARLIDSDAMKQSC